jgi:hypothetical protein
MKIGGSDIVIEGALAAGEGPFIVAQLRAAWPQLVVGGADSDEAVAGDDPSIAEMHEFFVYRSRADFESWTRDGYSEDKGNTMIHVITGLTSTTLVAHPHDELALGLRGAILSRARKKLSATKP